MKRTIIYNIVCLALLSLSLGSCKEHYVTYNDKEYVMFADTAQLYVVREDLLCYDVPVVSTVSCPYDRNFAVEVIDPSSSAVEGRDYALESNNFTIKAGELRSNVRVLAKYDNLDPEKQLHFTLRLIIPDRLEMPMYGTETIVRMQKTRKFDRKNFTGWAVLSSLFLYQYSITGDYQRLVFTEADPDNERGVIVHDMFAKGYDVKIWFDDDTDPASPAVYTPDGQVASDESTIFGMVHGDNHILLGDSMQARSYFLGHANIAVLYNRFYVQKIGEDIGTVGNFLSELDWISDEEAERLKREEGM